MFFMHLTPIERRIYCCSVDCPSRDRCSVAGKKQISSSGVSSVFASSLLADEMRMQKQMGRLEGCQFGTGLARQLPYGWEEISSRGGRKYFYHKKSGVSQWEEPDSEKADWVSVARPLTAPPERRIPGGKPQNYREFPHALTFSTTQNKPDATTELTAVREPIPSNEQVVPSAMWSLQGTAACAPSTACSRAVILLWQALTTRESCTSLSTHPCGWDLRSGSLH